MSTPPISFAGADLDAIDQQLMRRGIRPEVIAALSGSQPRTNPPASIAQPAQPGTRDYNLRVGATSQPRLPAVRLTEPTSPEVPQRQFSPDANVTPAQPARPASFGTPAVSLAGGSANPAQWQPSRWDNVVARNEGDRSFIANAKFQEEHARQEHAESKGELPAISFTKSNNPADPRGLQENASAAGPDVAILGARPTSLLRTASQAGGNGTAATQLQTPTNDDPRMARFLRVVTAARNGQGQRTLEDEYREKLTQEPTRDQFPAQHIGKLRKAAGIALSILAGSKDASAAGDAADRVLHGPERKAEREYTQAHSVWEAQLGDIEKAAKLREEDLRNRKLQEELDAKPDNSKDKKIDEGYNSRGQRVHVYQRQDGSEYTKTFPEITREPKQTGHSNAFEAFAYGTPEEKQSATDFLDMEHKLSRKYERPTEFDERYKLYQENPDAYRAMFGDKSGDGVDRKTATGMLNYFDRRRKEVNQDFTLTDDEKKQQLDEIARLEQPFMDAVQSGASRGGNQDRVEVIHPNGRRGTIPRSQLNKAKSKGYREAPQQ